MGLLSKVLDRYYAARLSKQLSVWHRTIGVYVFVLVVWGTYRMLLRLPVWLEEALLKAVVFGGPVFLVGMKKDGLKLKDLGITGDNLFPSVYMGLGLGMLLGFLGQIGNFVRHGGLEYSSYGLTSEKLGGFLLLSLVTGFWEELLFEGYILQRLNKVVSREWVRVVVVAGLFVILHLPALILVQSLSWVQLLLSMMLLMLLSAGNTVLMLRMKNLAAPMLAHALWGVVVYLFR